MLFIALTVFIELKIKHEIFTVYFSDRNVIQLNVYFLNRAVKNLGYYE